MTRPFGDRFHKILPLTAVILLQVAYAGMTLLVKVALDEGLSNYVLTVYRHAIATLVVAPFALYFERHNRPQMNHKIFAKLAVLGLLEPVIDQNLFYLGMKCTTPTFAAAIVNILPAITFIVSCIMRLDKVNIRSRRGQMKIAGTVATISGAMVMTLIKGPALNLFGSTTKTSAKSTGSHNIAGAILIIIGCFSNACFVILQTILVDGYPAKLTFTTWICFLGAMEGSVVALLMERGNVAVWGVGWGYKFVAVVYGGVVCSGLGYYIQGMLLKKKGPVFTTAFNPLCMVIVAVMSSIIFAEQMLLGRVIGAVIIVAGLYLVMWGMKTDEHGAPSSTNGDGDQREGAITDQHAAVGDDVNYSQFSPPCYDMA